MNKFLILTISCFLLFLVFPLYSLMSGTSSFSYLFDSLTTSYVSDSTYLLSIILIVLFSVSIIFLLLRDTTEDFNQTNEQE